MKRASTHAGTWYTKNAKELSKEVDQYMTNAAHGLESQGTALPMDGIRAVIGPHAGFKYSGPTAAYAYQLINTRNYKRVFVLGPSHKVYLDGCALSQCDSYETPFGDLKLDKQGSNVTKRILVLKDLYDTRKFKWMSQAVDENEHSLEMHIPFIYKLFQERIDQMTIVPIMVGSILNPKERMYGQILAPYLKDPENLFVISSDFCHWGTRFDYTYYTDKGSEKPVFLDKQQKLSRPIHESIEDLDQQGIHVLESLKFDAFQEYLARTENTICGRHPISVLLAALEELEGIHPRMRCVKYAQSSPCHSIRDSSVSYASLYVQFT
ncbi:MEMO1 family [Pilobolus umbonatus]|nr:MEMO1 family [Pilobolus umbonatus]